jgi:hypothetical protein
MVNKVLLGTNLRCASAWLQNTALYALDGQHHVAPQWCHSSFSQSSIPIANNRLYPSVIARISPIVKTNGRRIMCGSDLPQSSVEIKIL